MTLGSEVEINRVVSSLSDLDDTWREDRFILLEKSVAQDPELHKGNHGNIKSPHAHDFRLH